MCIGKYDYKYVEEQLKEFIIKYCQLEPKRDYCQDYSGSQPEGCQFDGRRGEFTDFNNVVLAEKAMKKKGYRKYKHCSHCWDGQVIDPIV